MGPENSTPDFTLYLDGLPLGPVRELGEVTFTEDYTIRCSCPDTTGAVLTKEYLKFRDTDHVYDFSVTIPLPHHLRCKTRKRFIKLLMGTGMSRRQAGWQAKFTQVAIRCGIINSYQDAWIRYLVCRITLKTESEKGSTDHGTT